MKCEDCSKSGRTALYIGESSRTFWDRASDHQKALIKDTSYGIVRHWQEWHPGSDEPPEFSYHLLGTHRSALERQIKEALAVEMTECNIIMNGKGEWGRNLIPRLQNTPLETCQKTQNQPQVKGKRNSDGFSRDPHGSTLQEPEISRRHNMSSSAQNPNQDGFLSQFKQRKRARIEHIKQQASTESFAGTDQWSLDVQSRNNGMYGSPSRARRPIRSEANDQP